MGQPMECTAYGMHKMYHIQYILCDRSVDGTDAEEALQPDGQFQAIYKLLFLFMNQILLGEFPDAFFT